MRLILDGHHLRPESIACLLCFFLLMGAIIFEGLHLKDATEREENSSILIFIVIMFCGGIFTGIAIGKLFL